MISVFFSERFFKVPEFLARAQEIRFIDYKLFISYRDTNALKKVLVDIIEFSQPPHPQKFWSFKNKKPPEKNINIHLKKSRHKITILLLKVYLSSSHLPFIFTSFQIKTERALRLWNFKRDINYLQYVLFWIL